jgi:hypothetical protein
MKVHPVKLAVVFAFCLIPLRSFAAHAPVLTEPFYHALWQFEGNASLESGLKIDGNLARLKFCAADKKIGRSGEVSRFQILPVVWRQYSRSRDYSNPDVAWAVMQRIIADRAQWFRSSAGREPGNFDLYLMWNAPGHYAKTGFRREHVRPVVRDRAERFSNLVESCSNQPPFKTARP